MKKLLLVGNILNSLKTLHDELSGIYQVQLCAPVSREIEGLIKIVKPDIIILFQSSPGEINSRIMCILKRDWENIPIIIICEQDEKHEFVSYISEEQTVFMFRPVKQEDLIMKINDILDGVHEDGTEVNAASGENHKPRVMIIDDNPIVLRNIKQILGDKYESYLAASGERALSMLRKVEVDLILLDYEMPDMNGIETFKRLKENASTADVPVIFLTGVADKHRIIEVLAYHPAGYMLKPIDAEKLKNTIMEALKDGE